MIMGAEILISNDYELELIVRSTGVTQADILAETAVIITTLGEGGSVIRTPDGETHVPAVTAAGVVDPTGAGDAYRAGLIKGLATGADLLHAARMGAVCASFAVEKHGTQTHAFTSSEFDERFRRDFG
jgi:adenosine kinase